MVSYLRYALYDIIIIYIRKEGKNNEDFETVMAWTKEIARLEVRMNAETSSDIKTGIAFDASGIGLARTEHMFFAPERLIEMRRFILSDSTLTRKEALETILSYQIEDFKSIFSTLNSNLAFLVWNQTIPSFF